MKTPHTGILCFDENHGYYVMNIPHRQIRGGVIRFPPNDRLAAIGVAAAALLSALIGPNPWRRSAFAQTIKPTVIVHTERLSQEERDYTSRMQSDLSELVAQYNWTDGKYRYPLPVQIEMFFDKYARSGVIRKYEAGILVALKNGVQIRDRRWEFTYSQDYRMHLGDPYDTFTGMIEYCVNICLGFEADRTAPLGGAYYYDRARQIGESARSEALYSDGWDDRRAFAFDLTDTTYRSVRLARFYTEAGQYYTGEEKWEEAAEMLGQAVQYLLKTPPEQSELHRGDYIIRFVDLDALANALRETRMKAELKALADWDPENYERYVR